jgi:NAD(P)-dependent dehydrogenase (short-subunit alcohol dehydrogenase family)
VESERVAVITGGGGAIGSAIASTLAADGLQIVVVDRTGDVEADLSSESSIRGAATAVLERGMDAATSS